MIKITDYRLTLWYSPRSTIRRLIQSGRGHGSAVFVSALFGLVQAGPFGLSANKITIQYFFAGAASGICGLYLFAWLLRNFGRWSGGQATAREVRTGLGLSLMPWLVLFGGLFCLRQLLTPEVLQPYYLLFFPGLVYGYTIILLASATTLRLSVIKTFFVLMITFVVSVFPLILIAQRIL